MVHIRGNPQDSRVIFLITVAIFLIFSVRFVVIFLDSDLSLVIGATIMYCQAAKEFSALFLLAKDNEKE